MKKLILILFSTLTISCNTECEIVSFSKKEGNTINVNVGEELKKKILSKFTFDEKNRVSTKKYSLSLDTYEVYYKYDSKNRLKEIIEERYVLDREGISQLFVTEKSTFIYNDLNPIKIVVYSKVNNHNVGYGGDTKTDYLIEYEKINNKISTKNLEILKRFSRSMLPFESGFVLQDYLGALPTKLVKSVIRKTDNEPNVKTSYNFKKNKENKITDLIKVIEFSENKNISISYKINYKCN